MKDLLIERVARTKRKIGRQYQSIIFPRRHLPLFCIDFVLFYLTVGVVVEDMAIGAEGLGSISGSVTSDTMFLRSCVAQALGRGEGPRHPLHASA